MDLYQITFPSVKKGCKPYNLFVHASDTITALHIFVDLVFDPTELYQDQIKDCLLAIFEDTYDDTAFDTDILMEPDDSCSYYRMGPLDYIDVDTFLNENRNNFKIFLQKYLIDLEDYITITKIRISNQPTITKSAR
jgi:hypothetical protein